MFGIGLPELILIMAVALIVVGPEKLPELAKSLAKGVIELKKTANALKDSLNEDDEEKPWDHIEPDAYPPTSAHPLPPAYPERSEKKAGSDQQKDSGLEQAEADTSAEQAEAEPGTEETEPAEDAAKQEPGSNGEKAEK